MSVSTFRPEAHGLPSYVDTIDLTPTPKQFSGVGGVFDSAVDAESLRKLYTPNVDIETVKKKYNFRPFVEAPPTKYADNNLIKLDALDFSTYIEGPEGLESRKALAKKLEKSLSTYGFINITNWGFPPEKLEYLKSIAQAILEIPEDEKLKYLAGAIQSDKEDKSKSLGGERGAGYKPRRYWSMQNGVRDNIELYNFRDMMQDEYFFDPDRNYPEVARAFLPEIAEYFRYIHFQVLKKLSDLCDLALGLPEGLLWDNFFKVYKNDLLHSGNGFGRVMRYLGMKPEEEALTENTWLRGHSDGTAFTFITSQPVLSLQIRDYYTGEWKYVGHNPNSLIVNVGDAMEFITGGYFKSSIHRVVAPPPDQRAFKRLVIIYFQDPDLTALLDPEGLESPRLRQLGIGKPEEWDKITFAQWNEEKGRLFGKKGINKVAGDEPTPVKLYGRYHERWHQAEKEQ